jgi:predicted dehydrogenase
MTASRRTFLKSTAASAALLATLPAVHAAGSDELKVGLVGCGGRGTGAAENAIRAGAGIKLWAMGDMFQDRLDSSRKTLQGANPDRVAVADDRCFVGFDAYQGVLASGIDVVVLATPPGFRPLHIDAAIAAGKHIFAEKPLAVDAPGVRRVQAAAAVAKEKNLALMSGFCWRYHKGVREAVARINEGLIGDVLAMQCSYNTGYLWVHPRQPGWNDMEYQLRNWMYFTWLSGDHNVEQHVHNLDKAAWILNQYPIRAVGLGGRQVRTGPEYGHIFDHHAVVYEFEKGMKCFSYCRQQKGCANDVSDDVIGAKGHAKISGINGTSVFTDHDGKTIWEYSQGKTRRDVDMYQQEHNDLFTSIRAGKPINDGDFMAKSTLMAIMGRMATYTGKNISWEMAWNSKEDLSPPKYEFGDLPAPPVAMPGQTKFI